MEPLFRKKILYSILSGLMLTASFPPGKLDWIVWFALIPLLKSLEKESYSHAFILGLITGLAHYLTLMYWIVVVLEAGDNFVGSAEPGGVDPTPDFIQPELARCRQHAREAADDNHHGQPPDVASAEFKSLAVVHRVPVPNS